MMASHLYVHLPFCRSRCAYCDFASEAVDDHLTSGRVGRYVEALQAEMDERGRQGVFQTVYVGGGTPTVLPRDLLLSLLTRLGGCLEADGEFTVEANPGTVDAGLLGDLATCGVTRLSLGVQSFAPALRAALGREVTQDELAESLTTISESGWVDWNLDLVFGIPGGDWETVQDDLRASFVARPAHISLYDLTYTPEYDRWLEARKWAGARRAADAMAERRYSDAVGMLEEAGYRRYEISNFALPGHECRHNQAYWRGEDYLGIGAAAVSTSGLERQTNPRTVADYLAGKASHVEILSQGTRSWEKAMLGLRTAEGVDESDLDGALDQGAVERLLGQGCLERRYGKLRLNPGFLDVSNAVIGTLLATPGNPRP